jgi:hypothetical protein
MFDRLARSWSLIKASAHVVSENKSLLLFPVLSGIASLIVVMSFVLPVAGDLIAEQQLDRSEPTVYAWMLLFYLALYFVSVFFNTALVSVALLRLSGQPAGIGDGLSRAVSRLPAILGYALIAASVGLLLRAIEERVGWIGRITAALIGVTWTVTTFLVVPCLAAREIGPLDAVKQSASLLRQTWGENIAGNAGIGLLFSLLYFVVFAVTIGLLVNLPADTSGAFVAVLGTGIVVFLGIVVVHMALQGVYAAALYCYATLGEAAPGFSTDALGGAFRNRRA